MRLTLIALLLAGVVGCDPTPEEKAAQSQPEDEAASDGDPQSQFEMGQKYDNGDGVYEDLTEAVEWNRKAAEQGDADAQCELGEAYRDGVGVPEDDVEGYAWISVAATNGDSEAKRNLPEVKAKLTPEQLTEGQKRVAELLEEINANKAK